MNDVLAQYALRATDLGLLFLRIGASVLVLIVHGLPKVRHFTSEENAIEDPFHLGERGKQLSIVFAIFAEVACPVLVIVGLATRLASLPVMIVSALAIARVHPEWTPQQAQFAWMLIIMFGTLVIAGAGHYSLAALLAP
ncbi:DoxX family protein [Burkholderia guangdongensis]|uniref:DoxX family protein n=1 Tax=Burkholderia guangdongensis TaxID=1792500 RepID=UPI0015CB0742|nr:DoxX family protein [Burkholderia guangdongensis]